MNKFEFEAVFIQSADIMLDALAKAKSSIKAGGLAKGIDLIEIAEKEIEDLIGILKAKAKKGAKSAIKHKPKKRS